MNNFIPYAIPDIGEEEIHEVLDSLRSGWLTTGPKTKKFEQDFQDFFGGEVEAVAVNSATAGLHLALEAIGIGPGDEVITTVHTFTATAEVIRYLGADPKFVDIDATFNIDVNRLEKAISKRTKAIIPVHFGGLACNMTKILEVAQKYNLKVVEDAAHALPSTHRGQLIGRLGTDATIFSFYANKTITTGEGGMLVTQSPEIAQRARVMRLHGINRDAFDRFMSEKPSWYYEIVAPGFKYNMTDLAASIGIHQLKKAWRFQKRRKEIADFYNQSLVDSGLKLPEIGDTEDTHSWHLYIIQLEEELGINRDDFFVQMSNHGVGCSVHYIPLHLHPYWRDRYELKPDSFPVSSSIYKKIISLPIYTKMTQDDVEKVVNSVKSILS